MTTLRYASAAANALLSYLQANLPARITTVSTEEAMSPALADADAYRQVILPKPSEALAIEVDVDEADPSVGTDIKNDVWVTSCVVKISMKIPTADLEAARKRLRAYFTAVVRTLRADPTLGAVTVDAQLGHATFSRVAIEGADSRMSVEIPVTTQHQET